MLRLRVTPETGQPHDLTLEATSLVIGRSSECDLVLHGPYMSRRHARLFEIEGQWWIDDLESRNGTLVNGDRITEPQELEAGDVIAVSGNTLRLIGEATPAPVALFRADDSGYGETVFRSSADLLESSIPMPAGETETADPLRSYAERLRLLNEVHQILAGSASVDELLQDILSRAFDLLEAEEGVIVLRQPDGTYTRAARRVASGYEEEHPLSETLVREVVEKGLAALVLDVAQDERFAEAESILSTGIRSLIAAPLADSQGALGMIALNSRIHRHRFTEADLELLNSVAAAAALRLRNLALADEAAERQVLEREVALARDIQVSLLPDQLPEIEGYDIKAETVPSRGVSGDFFEIIDHGDGGGCVLLVADVSGKGVGASLLTASLEALMAGPLQAGLEPNEVCRQVSARLFRRTPPAKYATAVLAILDPAAGTLTYTSAGHNPGLVVRAGGAIEELLTCGLPIGLMPQATYTQETVALEPGDLLVLYSDGITEAEDPDGEEFDISRLRDVCVEHRAVPLPELSDRIGDALEAFVRGVPFADDRTLLLLRRQPARSPQTPA